MQRTNSMKGFGPKENELAMGEEEESFFTNDESVVWDRLLIGTSPVHRLNWLYSSHNGRSWQKTVRHHDIKQQLIM